MCDKGLKWLSILPQNDFYCITAMMNADDDIFLWYVDMIAEQGIDVNGVPWFDDLYLDLVIYPDGTILVDDKDELDEALSVKDITREQYNLALQTSDELKKGLLSDISVLAEYTMRCKSLLDKKML